MAGHAIGRAEHCRAKHDIDREMQIRLPAEPAMNAKVLPAVDDAVAGDVAIGRDFEAEEVIELEPCRGSQALEQLIARPQHDEIDVLSGPRSREAELEGQSTFHEDVVAKVCDEPSHEAPEHEPLSPSLKTCPRPAPTQPPPAPTAKRHRR